MMSKLNTQTKDKKTNKTPTNAGLPDRYFARDQTRPK